MHNIFTPSGVYDCGKIKPQSPVRLAAASDISALAALEERVFPRAQYGADVLDAARLRYFLRRANALILVHDGDAGIDAALILSFKRNSNKARVYSLSVAPNTQGKGIAQKLMAAADNIAASIGLDAIRLETRADNTPMQRLCARCGYALLRIEKAYYPDGVDALKYQKNLAQNG